MGQPYIPSLDDLSKRDPERKQKALQALASGKKTPNQLAELWHIHPINAYKTLERARAKGRVVREGKGLDAYYTLTPKGKEQLTWYTSRKPERALGSTQVVSDDMGGVYPEIGLSQGILDGPIAAMRPVEVDYETFVHKGLEALPSKVTLTPADVLIEPKWDGWLVQIVKARIYSRRGKELTAKFPGLARAVKSMTDEFLLGELIYVEKGKSDESKVTMVAGTENPAEAVRKASMLPGAFSIVLYDVLAAENEDISKRPFVERREILEEMFKTRTGVYPSPVAEFKNWKKVFEGALDRGDEGIVIKNLKAPFFWEPLGGREPQRAGTQWKVKATRVDNFIVYETYMSEKDKLMCRYGQFYQGELVPIGDFNNLSGQNELDMVERLRQGPQLVELEFQERFPGFPGRLRNPRFRRFRDDVAPIPDNALLPKEYWP